MPVYQFGGIPMEEEQLVVLVDPWQDKYGRLLEAHEKLQKLNQCLEDKLLKLAEQRQVETTQLSNQVQDLTQRLVEARLYITQLEDENERYRNDINVVIQLLQCKPSNFISPKIDTLPEDLQRKVLGQRNGLGRKEKKIIKVQVSSFPPSDIMYAVDKGRGKPSRGGKDLVSAAIMAKVLQERENERKENQLNRCQCASRIVLPTLHKETQTLPSCTISYSDFPYSADDCSSSTCMTAPSSSTTIGTSIGGGGGGGTSTNNNNTTTSTTRKMMTMTMPTAPMGHGSGSAGGEIVHERGGRGKQTYEDYPVSSTVCTYEPQHETRYSSRSYGGRETSFIHQSSSSSLSSPTSSTASTHHGMNNNIVASPPPPPHSSSTSSPSSCMMMTMSNSNPNSGGSLGGGIGGGGSVHTKMSSSSSNSLTGLGLGLGFGNGMGMSSSSRKMAGHCVRLLDQLQPSQSSQTLQHLSSEERLDKETTSPSPAGSDDNILDRMTCGGGSGSSSGSCNSPNGIVTHWRTTVLVQHPPKGHHNSSNNNSQSSSGYGPSNHDSFSLLMSTSSNPSPSSTSLPPMTSSSGGTGPMGGTAMSFSSNSSNVSCSSSSNPSSVHTSPGNLDLLDNHSIDSPPVHHRLSSSTNSQPQSQLTSTPGGGLEQSSQINSNHHQTHNQNQVQLDHHHQTMGHLNNYHGVSLPGSNANGNQSSFPPPYSSQQTHHQYYRAQKRTFWTRSSSSTSTETEI